MDRMYLTVEIESARTELQRLRDERAKPVHHGDREVGARFRNLIATASADLADLEAELAAYDLNEAGEVRKAERARGRETAAAAIKATDDSMLLWAKLTAQLSEARTTAAALKAQGDDVAQRVMSAVRAQGNGHAEQNKLGLLIPSAAGSDSGTVEAVADELKALIDSLPGSFRLTSEWLMPNFYAFSRATPGPRPTLLDARTRATQTLRASLSTLCPEPKGAAR